MEFGVDGNVNSDVVGSSIELEGRRGDEYETGGNSIERAYLHSHEENITPDPIERDSSATDIPVDEPYIGHEFDSEAEAHAFYNAYATRVGFIIRVSKLSRSQSDGTAIGRALVCNKEGYRIHKQEKIVRQRVETRVGCRAMILVRKVSSGKWVVTKFEKEHTHALIPGKGRRDLIIDQYPVHCLNLFLQKPIS